MWETHRKGALLRWEISDSCDPPEITRLTRTMPIFLLPKGKNDFYPLFVSVYFCSALWKIYGKAKVDCGGGGWFRTRSIKCTMEASILSSRLCHAAVLSFTVVLNMIPTYHWSSSRKFLAGPIIAVRVSTQSSRQHGLHVQVSYWLGQHECHHHQWGNNESLFLGWKAQIFSLTFRKCSVWLMINGIIFIVFYSINAYLPLRLSIST